jgi:hypothetical protein
MGLLAGAGVLIGMCTAACGQTATLVPTWSQVSPASSPAAREGAAMAYNPATGQVVLFGGTPGGTSILDDTWTYDGTTWTQQSPATSPPARFNSMMTYDAATGKLVLFGGVGPNGSLGDTWTYDGTTWTQQSPATSPSARYQAAMAYDAASGQVVLFGGRSFDFLGDTWTYNGTTWTQQSPATSPSARFESAMTYDAATGQVVLFGGNGESGTTGDTWTYNGTTWTQQSPASSPTGRTRAAMAYDAATGQVVLFGGYSSTSLLDDTWTYDGTNWTQQSPANSPSGRNEAAMTYVAGQQKMVLLGGEGPNNALGDTWSYGPPLVPVGSTSATQTATLTITTSGSLSSISALTQGATGLDFNLVQNNTAGTPCTVGTDYDAGDTCTVQFTFTPLYPGLRTGGLRLSSSGATLATVLLTGTGTGPLVTFPPGTVSSINTFATSGFVPGGVAVDGSGVIYFSSFASDYLSPGTYRVVEKIPVGCTSSSCFQTLTGSLTEPGVLALDGVGTLYVGDYPNVKRIPAGCTSSGCMSNVGGAFQDASSLAVDGAGNVYVADEFGNGVYEIPPGCASSSCMVSLGAGYGWSNPTGIAVDASGNVYVADGHQVQGAPEGYSGQIHVMPPNCTSASCVTDWNNVFGSLGNISVDGVGNLYAFDTALGGNFGAAGLYELPAACRSCMVLLGSEYNFPAQSTVTGNETVYVADTDNHEITEINFTTPPTLTFPSTAAGQTSTSQSATVANAGNAPLIFAIPGTGDNPSVSTNFSISNSSTCPMLSSSSHNTAPLAAGSSCSQILSFAPTMAGTINGSSTVTDNNLNAAGATQSISLSGTGTKGIPAVSVVSPSVSVNTTAVTLEADISTPGTPSTGAVTFSVNGGSAIAATCTGSSSPVACTATYNPSSLAAGGYSIVATIAADSNYNGASGGGTLTVVQGTPTLSLATSGSTSKVNQSVTFTASVSPASGTTPTGKVSFSTTLNGITRAIPGCTSVSLVSGAGPSLKAACTTSALDAGSNAVSASLAADSNFTAASSNTSTQTVETVAPTVALSSSNSSSTVNAPVTFTATITPSTGITPTGAVTFTTTLNGSTSPIADCTSVALVGGAATCTTSALQAGSNTVKASIASDANFQAGSKSIGQTVNEATPVVTVQPVASSPVNSQLTFVASVSPTSGILPTGTVSFSTTLNGTTSAIAGCTAVPLVSATTLTASCTTSALAAGSNSITAALAGDANFNMASSLPVSQTITKGTPSLSLSTASGSSTVNSPVTFIAAATPSSGITPTGNVSFSTTLNGTNSAIAGCTSVPLSGLSASCTTSALGIGSNSVTASIASDSNFNAANSNSISETVNPGPLAKFLVPGAVLVAGTNNSLTITAQDSFGNTVTSFNGTVNLTSSDPTFAAGPSGNNTVTIQNGVSSTRYQLNTSGSQTITATDAANSAIAGTGDFTVTPGPVATLTVNAPTAATADAGFSFTVTGQDAFGNLSTSLPAQVHFSSSDPNALLPADTSLSSSPQTFSATFKTPGSQTLTVTSQTTPPVTGMSPVSVSTPSLIVTTLSDGAATPSACTVQTTGSTGTDAACTLRDAVAFANNAGAANITFAPALTAGATTATPATITVANEIDLSAYITVMGPGANLLRISGNQQTLIFKVGAGATVAISDLSLTAGFSGLGGAINNSGTLTLTADTLSGNSADLGGGGICQESGSLTIVASTISNNTAFSASSIARGGGLYVQAGSLTLQDSTISGNTGTGGGLFMQSAGTLTITRTTITGNQSPGVYGGIAIGSTPTTIDNSIIAGNSASSSADLSGSFTDNGGNVIGITGSGGTAVNPLLSTLGFYGGPTQTMVPLPGSPALCAGTAANLAGNPLDQRGFSRATVYGSTTCYDAGSVQSKYALAFVQQPTAILAGQAITPSPTVQVDEEGAQFSESGVNLGVAPSAGTLTGTTSQGTGASGIATFSGLSVATAESSETLTASLALSSAVTISTVSNAFAVTTPAPTVASLNPTSGPGAGGTSVTITGTNFSNASAVKFGAISATYTVNSSTQITAAAPAGAVGAVDVTVTTPGGTSTTSAFDHFTYVLASKTINFTPPTSPVAINSSATLIATASNGDPVTFSVTSGTASIHTLSGVSTITYTNAGSVTITANSAATSIYAAATPVFYTVVVNQIGQTITFPPPGSPVTYSTGLTTTLTASASSGLAVAYKVISGPANVSGAVLSYTGPGTVVVEADQSGDGTYTAATPMQRTIVVNAVPTITFTIPNQTYGAAPFQVNATSNSSAAFTYTLTSGNATVTPGGMVTLTGVGPVTIGVSQAAAGNFTSGSGFATFTVGKGTATIALGNLTQTYTGSPLPITASTTPTGLNVSITYAGSSTAPSAAGSYPIVATVVDSNHAGSTTGTLVIAKATAAVVLSNLTQTYTGSPLPVTASTTPTGLNVSITYAGGSTAPSAAGSYPIVATVVDPNYSGSTTGTTLVIAKATAAITLGNLAQTYTGSPLPITASTTPTGLNVSITYAGSSTAPTAAGSYAIQATVVDSNYTGSATGTLVIAKTSAAVVLSGLTQTYTGSPLPVTASTTPTGLNVSITYAGSSTAPTAAGSYPIVATIVDSNYTGSATGTLVIAKASATITLGNLAQTYTGSPLPITATTTPTGRNVSITYAGSSTAPTAAGSYPIVATIVDSNYTGSATGTLVIAKATATVALSNLAQTYTGSPLPITATTTPTGLNLSITYAGSSTAPTAAGSYPIVATVVDSNYTGGTTGTLIISKGSATITLSNLTQTYTGLPLPITATTTPTGLSVNITYATSSSAPTAAGSYAIAATIVDSNYTGSTTGTLLIQKAPVAVSVVPTSVSAAYGTDEHLTVAVTPAGAALSRGAAPTGTVTLLINGSTETVALANGDGTYDAGVLPSGPYTVTADYNGDPDYTGILSGSTTTPLFTITSGSLLVTANNATRLYGTANPTFTGNISGQQNGDTFSEAFTTTAVQTSPVGSYPIVPQAAGSNLADYTVTTSNGTLSITRAGTITTAVLSANSITTLQTLTVTATVQSSTSGTPTGSVQLLDGSSVIATNTLTGNTANFPLSGLAAGPHNFSVTYLGDTNFAGSSTSASLPATVNVADFIFTTGNSAQSQTVIPGQTANYTFQISPEPGGYPGIVTFTVSGLPPGATAVFTPNNIPVNGGPQTITLSVTTASIAAALEKTLPPRSRPAVLFGFLLLPLAGLRRIRRLRPGRVLLLFAASIATLVTLTGCGSGNGYFAQAQQSYSVTVTVTSGSVIHTTNVNLTVE